MPTKKSTAKGSTAKRPSTKKSVAKKSTSKKSATASSRGANRGTAKVRAGAPGAAKRGDLIILDSRQVGSTTRQGEVLEVIEGEVSVRYRVRWQDGHESLIAPASGTLTVAPTRT